MYRHRQTLFTLFVHYYFLVDSTEGGETNYGLETAKEVAATFDFEEGILDVCGPVESGSEVYSEEFYEGGAGNNLIVHFD